MVKKVLRSLLVISMVMLLSAGATKAWFTSEVIAEDNEIIVGSLMLALDSSREHTYDGTWGLYQAYTVVEDVDGVSTQYETFEPWINAQPGIYVPYIGNSGADVLPAGNKSIWVAFRNKGSLPMKVAGSAAGSWYEVPRMDPGGACDGQTPDDTLVVPRNVHFYASSGSDTANCENHEECRNIRDGLMTGPWSYAQGVSVVDVSGDPISGVVYGSSDGTDTGTAFELEPNEFVIARIDFHLDESTDSCYQGATYHYDLTGYAYQLGQPW